MGSVTYLIMPKKLRMHCQTYKRYESIEKCGLDKHHVSLLNQLYLAFCAAESDAYDQKCTERIVNGEVVSESESDNPEAYSAITDPVCPNGKQLIPKKRAAIRRRARRKQEKVIAAQHFFGTKFQRQ